MYSVQAEGVEEDGVVGLSDPRHATHLMHALFRLKLDNAFVDCAISQVSFFQIFYLFSTLSHSSHKFSQ